MLSSLPTELLRQIFESTITHTFHSQTYDDRQITLRHLSLVSHRFREIAQPLLFEIVSVHWPKKLEMVIDAVESKGWVNAIKQAALRPLYVGRRYLIARAMKRLARNGQGLSALNLNLEWSEHDPLDLSVLQLFPSKLPGCPSAISAVLTIALVSFWSRCRTCESSTLPWKLQNYITHQTSPGRLSEH